MRALEDVKDKSYEISSLIRVFRFKLESTFKKKQPSVLC